MMFALVANIGLILGSAPAALMDGSVNHVPRLLCQGCAGSVRLARPTLPLCAFAPAALSSALLSRRADSRSLVVERGNEKFLHVPKRDIPVCVRVPGALLSRWCLPSGPHLHPSPSGRSNRMCAGRTGLLLIPETSLATCPALIYPQ
jgi:hypothetical protein